MNLGSDRVTVRVPASSANLGPAFDCAGVALGVWDEITVRAIPGPSRVTIEGEGADTLPRDESHLIVAVVHRVLDMVGAPRVGLELRCVNEIPQGRGMGSSAAAITAGALIAQSLLQNHDALTTQELFNFVSAWEGHPDNAAPAVFGQACFAWFEGEEKDRYGQVKAGVARVKPHEEIEPVLLVPSVELLTEKARAVLPENIPHKDAAFSAGRAALLSLALIHRPSLLLPATQDKLHQDYRARVMPDSIDLVKKYRAAGFAAVVSGAGPTVLVFASRPTVANAKKFAPDGWQVLTPGFASTGATIMNAS